MQSLETQYAGLGTELIYATVYELLVSVILSAQCTDTRVNKVTGVLFQKYNTPQQISALSQDELESYIKSCGLYRAKAKNIIAASKAIVEKYNGEVPKTIEELRTLAGVGRKTANVVAAVGYNIPAIAVDTHVFRVSNRTGIAKGKTPLAVEEGLMKLIPREKWGQAHHQILLHGRRVCKSQSPLCDQCLINSLCEHKNIKKISWPKK